MIWKTIKVMLQDALPITVFVGCWIFFFGVLWLGGTYPIAALILIGLLALIVVIFSLIEWIHSAKERARKE